MLIIHSHLPSIPIFPSTEETPLALWKWLISVPFSLTFSCLLFFSLHVQPYTSPDNYFLNCGSQTTVFSAGRTFIGDLNATNTISFRFTPQNFGQVVDHSTKSPSLYDSNRIFKDSSFYEFEVDQDVVHIVRLHFSPFNFSTDLSTSLFNVSAVSPSTKL